MGRTGTFITLDAMMERLKEKDDLNIFEFVNEMRTRRMYMVQTLVGIAVYLHSDIVESLGITLLCISTIIQSKHIYTICIVNCHPRGVCGIYITVLKGAKRPSAEWSKLPKTPIGLHLAIIDSSDPMGSGSVLLLFFAAFVQRLFL